MSIDEVDDVDDTTRDRRHPVRYYPPDKQQVSSAPLSLSFQGPDGDAPDEAARGEGEDDQDAAGSAVGVDLPGTVQHLALDVERFWFRGVVAGEQTVIDGLADTPAAWHVAAEAPAAAVFDVYRQEIERATAIITATPLEAAPAWWPADHFGDFRLHNLREVMLHVLTETACHAGHLDAVRELIDGRRWLVLTE